MARWAAPDSGDSQSTFLGDVSAVLTPLPAERTCPTRGILEPRADRYVAQRSNRSTHAEQRVILRTTAGHPRDHAIYSLALGTGLRLGEIVGLNVGDV